MLLNRKFIKILLDRKYKPSLNEFSNLSCGQIKWYLRIRVGRKGLSRYLFMIHSSLSRVIDTTQELLCIKDGCKTRGIWAPRRVIKQPELTVEFQEFTCYYFPTILTKRGIIRMTWNEKGKDIKVKLENDSHRICKSK